MYMYWSPMALTLLEDARILVGIFAIFPKDIIPSKTTITSNIESRINKC